MLKDTANALYKLLGLRAWVAIFLASCALCYAVYRVSATVPYAPLLLLLVAIPLGFSATRLLLEVPGGLRDWMLRARYEQWQGRHFSYQSIQVRVFWDDSVEWIHADDVFLIVGHKPDRIERKKLAARFGAAHYHALPGVSGECFSYDSLVRYLSGLRVEEAWKFRRWLEREVLPNIRKLREMGSDQFQRHALDEDKR